MNALALLLQAGVPDAPHGPGIADVLGTVAIVAIATGVVGLVLIEFVWRDRIARSTYRWLLLLGLAVAPAFALGGATGTMFEQMKEVAACNSCHVMNRFVEDMRDPNSATLAARHHRTGAIPGKQCYSCHTGYGIFGTLEAKRDGFRHWLLYVTGTWPEPIAFRGTYPNANCLHCHARSPEFRGVPSHTVLRAALERDQMNCTTCHGLPHPARPLRVPRSAEPVGE